jgi:hypothetical protein
MAMCPPQYVLRAFVEQTGLGRMENSFVFANIGVGCAPTETSAEAIMLRVLDEYGPILDGEDFAERCIVAGVNAITFYIYRGASPVITPLGRNIYCKVGTEIPPGTIEELLAKRRPVKRLSDYGWTITGRLWVGTELSRMVITFGSIGLPTFVADLVQGEWNVRLPDGAEHGTVTCRDTFIYSFARPFTVLGAEPTDLAILEFDLKSRNVMVRVGGPDLLEAIQDPESDTVQDEGEDA